MSKADIESILGKGVNYKNTHLYRSHKPINPNRDNSDYRLTLFFNEKNKVNKISIRTNYNEDY